jgi:hypothetical protein
MSTALQGEAYSTSYPGLTPGLTPRANPWANLLGHFMAGVYQLTRTPPVTVFELCSP